MASGLVPNMLSSFILFIVPPYQPLVGRDFNVTSAGVHADGLLKNEEIYNIFDTAAILGRPPSIAARRASSAFRATSAASCRTQKRPSTNATRAS